MLHLGYLFSADTLFGEAFAAKRAEIRCQRNDLYDKIQRFTQMVAAQDIKIQQAKQRVVNCDLGQLGDGAAAAKRAKATLDVQFEHTIRNELTRFVGHFEGKVEHSFFMENYLRYMQRQLKDLPHSHAYACVSHVS
jgi:hypothetical protein